jgi:hypothetical protein
LRNRSELLEGAAGKAIGLAPRASFFKRTQRVSFVTRHAVRRLFLAATVKAVALA